MRADWLQVLEYGGAPWPSRGQGTDVSLRLRDG